MGSDSGAVHSQRLRFLGVGTNLVAVCLAWPMLFGAAPTALQWVGVGVASAMLAVATLALPPNPDAPSAPWTPPLVVMGLPLTVGACMLAQPVRVHLQAFGIFGTLVAGASLLAYGGVALTALGGDRTPLPTTARETRRQPWDTPADPEPPLQRPLLALGTLGALCIGVVAPLWGGLDRYERYWGEAAAEGATLTATVAVTLACTVLAVFVGGAMRTRNSSEPPATRARVVSLLAAAGLGFAVYAITQP